MDNKSIRATTPHGELEYTCTQGFIEADRLVTYVQVEKFSELCRKGCPNYAEKWSCPPYVPKYKDFTKKYKYVTVIVLSINMSQFSYISNDYLKIKAANSILKSRIDKTLRKYISQDMFYISTGSCRLCKPCKHKKQQPCAHPDMKTYSYEALGINVTNMLLDIFEIELLWYRKKQLPEYTCVVGGILSNEHISEENIIAVLEEQN